MDFTEDRPTIMLALAISLLTGVALTGAIVAPSTTVTTDSSPPDTRIGQTTLVDQQDRLPAISPGVQYSVTNLTPAQQTAQLSVTYSFSTPIHSGSLTLPQDTEFVTYQLVQTPHTQTSATRLNITETTQTITLTYRVNLTEADSVRIQYIGSDNAILTRPRIQGTVTTSHTTYRLTPTTSGVATVTTPATLGNTTSDTPALYESPTARLTETTLFVADTSGLSVESLSGTRGYNTTTLIATQDRINTTPIQQALSLIDRQLGHTVDRNDLVVLAHPGLGRDYYGALFDNSNDSRTAVIDSQRLLLDRSTTTEHELVHAYQDHTVTDTMRWWTEGSAEYLSAQLAYTTGTAHDNAYSAAFESIWATVERNTDTNGSLTGELATMQLTDPNTWQKTVQYRRGAAVTSQIDRAIRNNTANKTIYTLVEWMNTRTEPITLPAFLDKVETLTSHSFRTQLHQYLTGTSQVEPINTIPPQ